MTKSKKAKSFTYMGALDSVEIYGPAHSYIFAKGEAVEVCGEDVAAIGAHPDITAGSSSAPVDPIMSEEA